MSEDDRMLFPTNKQLTSYNLIELLDWAKDRRIDIPTDYKRWSDIYKFLIPYYELPIEVDQMNDHDLELCCRFRKINIPSGIKSLYLHSMEVFYDISRIVDNFWMNKYGKFLSIRISISMFPNQTAVKKGIYVMDNRKSDSYCSKEYPLTL